MISAEGPPLARATALVDVLQALPRELRARKHEVAITMPYYREIREDSEVRAEETGVTVDVRVGRQNYLAEYLEGRTTGGYGRPPPRPHGWGRAQPIGFHLRGIVPLKWPPWFSTLFPPTLRLGPISGSDPARWPSSCVVSL